MDFHHLCIYFITTLPFTKQRDQFVFKAAL